MSFFAWDASQVNHFMWVSLLGTRHKWTTSYEFLYLGHDTTEPLHMSFFTWDTTQVNHFIWVSLIGTRHKQTNSYMNFFNYLGYATSKPLHMNFFTWDTPQVNHFIWVSLLGTRHKWTTSWISLLGTRHKWTTSYELLYLEHAASEPLHMNFFIYLGYATSEPLHMNLFMWAPHSKRAHVSPTACFDKKAKSKGRKYPSKGRKYPSKGRNFPCVVSEVCHVKFYNFWKGTCKTPFRGMCNRLGLPDPFWGGGDTFVMSKRVCLTYSRLAALAFGW